MCLVHSLLLTFLEEESLSFFSFFKKKMMPVCVLILPKWVSVVG